MGARQPSEVEGCTRDPDELTVYLVDEDPQFVRHFQEMTAWTRGNLRLLGSSPDFAAGIRALAGTNPHVLLMNIMSLNEHKADSCFQVKRLLPETALVLLADPKDEEAAARTTAAGAQDYLVKGRFDAHMLFTFLRTTVERAQLLRKLHWACRKLAVQRKATVEEERLRCILETVRYAIHDMNQPLTSLLGNIELLRMNKEVSERLGRYLDRLEKGAEGVFTAIRRIQNLRKEQTGPYEANPLFVGSGPQLRVVFLAADGELWARCKALFDQCEGLECTGTDSCSETERLVRTGECDFLLIDDVAFRAGGRELIGVLNEGTHPIPVILVTAGPDVTLYADCLEAGVNDILASRDLSPPNLLRSLAYALEYSRIEKAFVRASKQFEAVSEVDTLTGLLNRRRFVEMLKKKANAAPAGTAGWILCVVRIQGLEAARQDLGYRAQELVLSRIAQLAKSTAPKGTLICRYDEGTIAALLNDMPLPDAHNLCATIQSELEEEPIHLLGARVPVALATGLAPAGFPHDGSIEDWMVQAIKASRKG